MSFMQCLGLAKASGRVWGMHLSLQQAWLTCVAGVLLLLLPPLLLLLLRWCTQPCGR